MKFELLGILSAIIPSGIILIIVRSESYLQASNNMLLVVLLMFAVAMMGLGISKLFIMMDSSDDNTTKPKNVKDKEKKFSSNEGFNSKW